MGQHMEHEKHKSCCTWPKIVVASLVLIAGGVVIWQFAPIDEAIDSVLPTFNNTGNGGSNNDDDQDSASSPTAAPTAYERYEFMQCADPNSANCCNGLDNGICDLRVDEVLYATSHNANADFESDYLFAPNHLYKLETSLEAGYRGINVDVCNCGGELVFCHGTCAFGTRDILEVFTNINDFLDNNPSEIIVLPIELNSEVGQAVDLDELYGIMQQVSGFVDKFYHHENRTADWPTLGDLVQSNQRMIVFHYRGPTCDDEGTCPTGLHYYHRYAVDTQWDLPNLDAVNDNENSCVFAETPGLLSKTFFGLNNFVSTPTLAAAQTMNTFDFIQNRIEACSTLNDNLDVNFVYVNYWSVGDLPQLVQEKNTALAARRKLNVRRGV